MRHVAAGVGASDGLPADVRLEMDVRRAPRIVARIDRPELGHARGVGDLHPAEPGLADRVLGRLVGVDPARIALPDVARGTRDRLAGGVDELELQIERHARPAESDVLADLLQSDVERPLLLLGREGERGRGRGRVDRAEAATGAERAAGGGRQPEHTRVLEQTPAGQACGGDVGAVRVGQLGGGRVDGSG